MLLSPSYTQKKAAVGSSGFLDNAPVLQGPDLNSVFSTQIFTQTEVIGHLVSIIEITVPLL